MNTIDEESEEDQEQDDEKDIERDAQLNDQAYENWLDKQWMKEEIE